MDLAVKLDCNLYSIRIDITCKFCTLGFEDTAHSKSKILSLKLNFFFTEQQLIEALSSILPNHLLSRLLRSVSESNSKPDSEAVYLCIASLAHHSISWSLKKWP